MDGNLLLHTLQWVRVREAIDCVSLQLALAEKQFIAPPAIGDKKLRLNALYPIRPNA
jgi:hypothetical protein